MIAKEITKPVSLIALSATELTALIVRREVSSVEVVEAHIGRIEQVNPALNIPASRRYNPQSSPHGRSQRRWGER